MKQCELNQSVEAQALSFGGGGCSKRDLLYAAAMLRIEGRSRMSYDELCDSVIAAWQQGVDERLRPQIETLAGSLLAKQGRYPGSGAPRGAPSRQGNAAG